MLIVNLSSFISSPEEVSNQVNSYFRGKAVAVRSSASDEDGASISSAGKYHTELNVPSSYKSAVCNALENVVASYSKSDSIDQAHQIIV